MKQYSVTSLCRLLGVSTQAYYKHGDTAMRKLAEEAFCVEYIRRIRQKDRGIGGGKLWRMYRASFGEEHSVGYNRFYDIIDKYGLIIPVRPNQLWVSDITYMAVCPNGQTDEYTFCYLSLVTDYYTKEIIGWCVGQTLATAAYSMPAMPIQASSRQTASGSA